MPDEDQEKVTLVEGELPAHADIASRLARIDTRLTRIEVMFQRIMEILGARASTGLGH